MDGDANLGGLLSEWLRGLDFQEAAEQADADAPDELALSTVICPISRKARGPPLQWERMNKSGRKKVVLAYSGGLDTSVSIKWLAEKYDAEVVALTIDLGQEKKVESVKERALQIGAVDAYVVDAQEQFLRYCAFPSLQAGALYEGVYPLATALARPIIAWHLVDVAHKTGAFAVAHGCTGKGNDQVRFELAIKSLDPTLEVIAPVREWSMTRDQELEYAAEHEIPLPENLNNRYSVDANLWGRSIEAGELEDPNVEPEADVFEWTSDPAETPDEPRYLTIHFEHGIPTALDGETLPSVQLVKELNTVGGRYGIGRVDHVENRLVGIKSREIYEAPAAIILFEAHRALETLTLSKDTMRFKAIVANEYSELIYNGKRFSQFHDDLLAFVLSSQQYVTGGVRIKLHKGSMRIVGRSSNNSLYNKSLATYEEGDQFDHNAAIGFIKLYGMQTVEQLRLQRPISRTLDSAWQKQLPEELQ